MDTAVDTARAVENAGDIAKGVDNAVDAAKGIDKAVDAGKAAENAAEAGKGLKNLETGIELGLKRVKDGVYEAPKEVMDAIGKLEAKGQDFTKLKNTLGSKVKKSTEGGVSRVMKYYDDSGLKFAIHEVTDAAGNILHRDFDSVRIASGEMVNKISKIFK